MAARAIWKGTIRIGKEEIPVKLYSAVQERSIHFRLLHGKDKTPVKQQMVNPDSGDPVESDEIHKAYPIDRNTLVILEDEDLESVEPEPSRDIEVTRFVDPQDIDHRWYERAYYLGPDRSTDAYFALAEALETKNKEGVARWVMRKKSYVGALRADDGYLMLIALRHADEVVNAEDLEAPKGRALEKKEIAMATQLIEAFSDTFDPAAFQDDYRERVMDLVRTKAKGGKVKVAKFTPKIQDDDSLDRALQASIANAGKKKAAGGR